MATGPALVLGQLSFPLNQETNSVGRKDRITNLVPDVDLVALDQERSVSRKHAEVVYDHGTMALRDVGSTNGTTVNGDHLAHQVDRPLQDGDQVAFGGVTMTFAAAVEWPEGVEAEWPAEPEPAPEETMISSPEETMVAAPWASEETMVAPPSMAEETMVALPPDFSAGETAVFAPGEIPGAEPQPLPVEPEPAIPEPASPAPVLAAPVEAPVYVSCSNHPHLPAIGVCPGCLEAFCVDCLPEREDGLMVCNRCAGISYRLGAATAVGHGAYDAPAPAATMPASSPFPDPMPSAVPQPAPPPAEGDKKKKWPF